MRPATPTVALTIPHCCTRSIGRVATCGPRATAALSIFKASKAEEDGLAISRDAAGGEATAIENRAIRRAHAEGAITSMQPAPRLISKKLCGGRDLTKGLSTVAAIFSTQKAENGHGHCVASASQISFIDRDCPPKSPCAAISVGATTAVSQANGQRTPTSSDEKVSVRLIPITSGPLV